MASSSRGRERRGEYRPSVRRSRSPVPPKRRSYSPPPMKRKAASPVAEREMARRTKISKSPVGARGGSRGAPDVRYNTPAVEPDPRPVRNVSNNERFRERDYEEDRATGVPQFRGPEGSVDFDINELKKFTIEIVRKPSSVHGDSSIKRSIIDPDNIAPVRRPGMRGSNEESKFRGPYYSNRGNFQVRGHFNNHHTPSPKWKNNQVDESYDYTDQNEGSRPLFLRSDASTSKERGRSDDYQRIVAIDSSRGSGHERAHSRERPPQRYSPGPSHYEDNRRSYYNERERAHSPYEARHRSPPRDEYVDPREKHRERRGGSREDLRRDLEVRKREERRYTPERRLSYERDQRERESDLRSRINEKRSDLHPNPRIEERERERRYEGERERGERHGRSHHSSPPRERRRPASPERHEGSRDRRETWERDRERDGRERESSKRRHSREREPREHADHHYEDPRRPTSSHKNDYEPKKFYKNYEAKEFIPPPVRGRGLPMRRGVPPLMRGRGIVRGMSRGFRGGVMVPRGIPRGGPFIPRGFPPRFFPPY